MMQSRLVSRQKSLYLCRCFERRSFIFISCSRLVWTPLGAPKPATEAIGGSPVDAKTAVVCYIVGGVSGGAGLVFLERR